MKITSVLYVDRIEPSLEFWSGRLGFAKTVEVPHGDALGFVILTHGGAELMLQTHESFAADQPKLTAYAAHPICGLFIEVDDFADLLRRLEPVEGAPDVEVVMPVRTTFYGMQEIVVREPGGNLTCFAARV
jgi:uncharacterized glyoxalase superfamily protein PhnB